MHKETDSNNKDYKREDLVRYKSFISEIPKIQTDSKSLFWEKEIKRFDLRLTSKKDKKEWLKEIDKKVQSSDFGFRPLRNKRIFLSMPFLKDFIWAYAIRTLRRLIKFLGYKKYEHAWALEFMRRKGLLNEYLEFINSFNVESQMQIARHFYYLKTLYGVSKEYNLLAAENLNFLEIGAGAGIFALFCFKKFPILRYVIVDLPEMIGFSYWQFLKYGRDIKIVAPNEFSLEKFNKPEGRTVYFLTPDQINLLPSSQFHVSQNFYSFSEMERKTIDHYFSVIYNLGAPNSIFYHVNRHKILKNRDGTVSNNNPAVFPYRADDEVLRYCADEFHYAMGLSIRRQPPFTIMRLAKIKPYLNHEKTKRQNQ